MGNDEDEDVASIRSTDKLDQITFWTLSIAWMVKLVAMGMAILALPFNEWIILTKRTEHTEFSAIRGISGSDCVFPPGNPKAIECVRWTEKRESIDAFWSKRRISSENVELPSIAHRFLYYLILFQLLLFALDLVATFVMCKRYKLQKDGQTREKRISLIFFTLITIVYCFVSITVVISEDDFLNAGFESSLGSAFKVFFGSAIVFIVGFLLTNTSRFAALRLEGVDCKSALKELFCSSSLSNPIRQEQPPAQIGWRMENLQLNVHNQ